MTTRASTLKYRAKRLLVMAYLWWATNARWVIRLLIVRSKHGLPGELVVSITSYPPRFGTLALTLKTLLSQSVRPDRVVLWIAHTDQSQLPESVLRLASDGLEIRYCDDTRSYKKIIPALSAFPGAYIVIADDDVRYLPRWLQTLVSSYDHARHEVIFHRGHMIALNGAGLPLPYKQWNFDIKHRDSSTLLFPTGVGGVLYRPGIFHQDVTDDVLFQQLCPTADDIWLYFMARRTGAEFRILGTGLKFRVWYGTEDDGLILTNVAGGGNDRQMKAMVDHFGFAGSQP